MFSRPPPLRVGVTAALPDGGAADELLSALIQHVLFMHQQIPCVYPELKRELDTILQEKRRAVGGIQRKVAKLVSALDPLLENLTPALDTSAAATPTTPCVAAIVLGSSVASPRLVYLLGVGIGDGESEDELQIGSSNGETSSTTSKPSATPSASSSRSSVRRLLRSLAANCAEIGAVDPGLCRVSLLLSAPRTADAGALASAGFVPRPALTLKLQRAHVATIATYRPHSASGSGGGDGGGAMAVEPPATEARADGQPPTWLCGGRLLSGYQPPPPPRSRIKRRRLEEADDSVGVEAATEMAEREEAAQAEEAVEAGAAEDAKGGVAMRGAVEEGAGGNGSSGNGGGGGGDLTEGVDGRAEGDHAIWWQWSGLIKGFRLPSNGGGSF